MMVIRNRLASTLFGWLVQIMDASLPFIVLHSSVVDYDTLYWDPDPEFWPNLDTDLNPGFCHQF